MDIFAVPDYDAFLLPEVDKSFKRYCKEAHTQLVFTFEAVGICPDFPTGCKTSYRAYCKDKVIEIVEHDGSLFNLRAHTTMVSTFPAESETQPAGNSQLCALFICVNFIMHSGMYIMMRPPRAKHIEVVPFLAGSRVVLEKCLSKIRKVFHNEPSVVAEWEAWGKDVIPQSDFVEEHLKM